MGRENTSEGSLNGFRYNCILRLITYFKKRMFPKGCIYKDVYDSIICNNEKLKITPQDNRYMLAMKHHVGAISCVFEEELMGNGMVHY